MALSLDLQEIFPLTFSVLDSQTAAHLRSEFMRDWGSRHLHFFPMVVREKKLPAAAIEAADYEFQLHFLAQEDFPVRLGTDGNLMLHPSCQFLQIEAASDVLKIPKGLYVLWKSTVTERIEKKILNLPEAAVLDRLQEGMIVYRQDLSRDEKLILEGLLALGIVCEGPSSELCDEFES